MKFAFAMRDYLEIKLLLIDNCCENVLTEMFLH